MKEPKPTEFNWSDPIDIDEIRKGLNDAIEKEWENYKEKLMIASAMTFEQIFNKARRGLAYDLFHDKEWEDGKDV